MAEIKSTLDLVLEKTRHLTLSPEERDVQRRNEFKKGISGLVQKYQDRMHRKDQFEAEWEALQKTHGILEPIFLMDELLDRLDPDADNAPLLELLEDICRVDGTGIASLMDAHGKAVREAVRDQSRKRLDELAQMHRISGSAVVPNPDRDPQWQDRLEGMREQFRRSVDQKKKELGKLTGFRRS